MIDSLTFDDLTIHGLAGTALHPKLRAVLLLDATPEQVQYYACLMAEMMEAVTGLPPASYTLHPAITEEQLWGLPALPLSEGGFHALQEGLLRTEHQPRLMVIPNLANLNLAASRAAVVAVGSDVLHVERHGQHEQWQPNLWWLAGCAASDIGQVSPHLLDRFLVRIPVAVSERVERTAADLMTELTATDPASTRQQLHPDVLVALQNAAQTEPPHLSTEAAELLRQYVPTSTHYSLRRDLALARLAVAQAWLAGEERVRQQQVYEAVTIMRLSRQQQKPAQSHDDEPKLDSEKPAETDGQDSLQGHEPSDKARNQPPENNVQSQSTGTRDVYKPDQEAVQSPITASTPSAKPYAEDEAQPDREQDSLRLPISYAKRDATGRGGAAIGVEPAVGLDDLSIVGTLFEALKYQRLRRQQSGKTDGRLIIEASDLRRYRRLPLPETLLVLVIDYTALDHCDWTAELTPYLQWAYTSRARIALIRVGAATAPNELQAQRLVGRNLLDPAIGRALLDAPGKATPLAHGLDLAQQTLRHELQHGRSAIVQAQLVVISDGRGNVPLSASYTNEVPRNINREGVDDALEIARAIREFDPLDIHVVDTLPPQQRDLLLLLADRLGTPLETKEVA